jgi:pyruvate dehydrogenase E1 component alpha subunit
MLLIRRFEERAGQLYGMGLIGGFCHLYIGQEAVVVGMQANVRDKDAVITSYRDHGHMLACGMDPKGVMAELTGRSGGYSKGKGGSMHMFSREKSFYGGHGIVGAQVPIGTGLAFAHKYNGNKNVSLTYFGDGSANQGQVYEAMNMAALWKLPVVYIIENNRYGMAPPSSAPRPRPNSIATAKPSASRASGSTAWMCWRCGRPARRPSSTRAAGRGPTSSRCRPIAIAATR